GAVPFSDPSAVRAVHADGMDLVEIGHRVIPLGDIANLYNWRDIAIHRIDRLETDELRLPRIGAYEAVFEVARVVVAEDLVLSATVPGALDHRGVVCGIGEDDTVRSLPSQRGNSRLIGHVSRREEQRSLLAVQVGK